MWMRHNGEHNCALLLSLLLLLLLLLLLFFRSCGYLFADRSSMNGLLFSSVDTNSTFTSGIIKVVGASTFHSKTPDGNAKSKSTTNLSVADDAPHSEKKMFGMRRTHSSASK